MNTFLSLTSDMNIKSMPETMEFVKKVEVVANSVHVVWSDSVAEGNFQLQSRSRAYIDQFSGMILDKIDTATAHLLRFIDHHVNDKAEINIEESADKVSMGMWASFNDNRPIRKSVQFEKMGVQLDVPKQILNQESRFVHRVLRIPMDTLTLAAYEPSKSSGDPAKQNTKMILGDSLQIDILLPPPQAFTMRAKKWTIRDSSSVGGSVVRSPYPSSVACRFYFKVPSEVVMSDDVRVAIWDNENKVWTEDGLSDYQYAESTRMAQVYIAAVGTVALVRERVWEMPYRSWSLKALRNTASEIESGEDSTYREDSGKDFERQTRFTLMTANHEIVIDIIGTCCELVSPSRPELADLIGVKMSPGLLLSKLQRRGLNLLPTARDLASVTGVVPKVTSARDASLSSVSHTQFLHSSLYLSYSLYRRTRC